MFAVKGLKVSTDKLKVETEHGSVLATQPPRTVAAGEEGASAPKNKNKKRKRAGRSNNTDVNLENVADLWEKVIEGGDAKAKKAKEDAKKEAHKAKKQKTEEGTTTAETTTTTTTTTAAPQQATDKKKNKKNKNKQESKPAAAAEKKQDATTTTTTTESKPSAPAPAAPKLTPLQAAMREKLISARFRHLNETLYTRPSRDAFSLFSDSPEMFTEYHEGFRRQVDVWPENPVDGYISAIKTRGKLRNAPRTRPGDGTSDGTKYPLPRDRNGLCTIADLGCGDAKLAQALVPLKRKLGIEVKSYDLQDGGKPELITRADIANLPLKDGSVDVVIFCLALMGTNWIDFVEEAYRVLRWKGELWVAEIKSRFVDPTRKKGSGPGNVVSHSVGNRRKAGAAAANNGPVVGKKDKAKMKEEEEAEEEQQLAVHVDGVELRQQETDVSAFVEALRKRGFLLQREYGQKAVDMDNKMFVKMHFVKAMPAIKGKCADLKKEALKTTQTDAKGRPIKTPKFIDADEEDSFNENALLKPCVYKIR